MALSKAPETLSRALSKPALLSPQASSLASRISFVLVSALSRCLRSSAICLSYSILASASASASASAALASAM